MVESRSEVVLESRDMAPPYAPPTKLVAMQWDMAEWLSVALLE